MRQDQYDVTVSLKLPDNSVLALGTFDTFEGGEVDSDETKYKPGGMAPHVSLGGSKTVGNVTVSRLYSLTRDHLQVARLVAAVGTAEVTVTKQPLDVDGNAFGLGALVYTGKLKTVTFPEVDSESSDAAMIELEVSTAGTIAMAA
jgi:hypothetical protein